MPMASFCPGCHSPHTFLDSLFGKKVRCKNCEKYFFAGHPEKGMTDPPDEPLTEYLPPPIKTVAPEPPLRRKQVREEGLLQKAPSRPVVRELEEEEPQPVKREAARAARRLDDD